MSAFDDIEGLISKARKILAEEGVNPTPPLALSTGISTETPNKVLEMVYKEIWDGVVIRLLELGEDKDLLLENLMAYRRSFDRWGLWFPIFGCVHTSYLPSLYNKAKAYYDA